MFDGYQRSWGQQESNSVNTVNLISQEEKFGRIQSSCRCSGVPYKEQEPIVFLDTILINKCQFAKTINTHGISRQKLYLHG